MKGVIVVAILLSIFFSAATEKLYAQAEVQAWGNITGVRVDGELMGVGSSLRLFGNPGSVAFSTGQEKQKPAFIRNSSGQVVTTKLSGVSFIETVTDIGTGKADVTLKLYSKSDTTIAGAYFCISLPMSIYRQGTLSFGNAKAVPVSTLSPDDTADLVNIETREFNAFSPSRQLKIQWKGNETIFARWGTNAKDPQLDIYFPLANGEIQAADTIEKKFSIEATGTIDKKEIHLTLDVSKPGKTFAGFGGNFRIQNLKNDPQVIDYCLDNMRVAWGRVEMPWRFWQPEQNADPVAAAKAGHLDDHVQRAMTMAQKLQQRKIPIILTAWAPPAWAIIGKPAFGPRDGVWGNPLNPDSTDNIYKSIADYIQYLKDQYGVDIQFFSFNESDLGINVRQTGEEHLELIKGLGKYFVSRGLQTKLLLGDNSDATTYTFIEPALKDASARPYIGAVSFHSWRGWETELLSKWAAASREINLPLIVGEGSIDAAAWAYPGIFLEQTYSLAEINLYIRLLAICQPLSILQWQLTSDYSPLIGAGIFGSSGPLEPTQRFWNLKQLAATPEGLNYLPVSSDQSGVTSAALGNSASGKYVFHIVNSGAERKVIISGIPAGVKSFKIVSTTKSLSMKPGDPVSVRKGTASFRLPAAGYTTLTSE